MKPTTNLFALFPELEFNRFFTPAEVFKLGGPSTAQQRQHRHREHVPFDLAGEEQERAFDWEQVSQWVTFANLGRAGVDLTLAGKVAASRPLHQLHIMDFRNFDRPALVIMFRDNGGEAEVHTSAAGGISDILALGDFWHVFNWSNFQRKLIADYEALSAFPTVSATAAARAIGLSPAAFAQMVAAGLYDKVGPRVAPYAGPNAASPDKPSRPARFSYARVAIGAVVKALMDKDVPYDVAAGSVVDDDLWYWFQNSIHPYPRGPVVEDAQLVVWPKTKQFTFYKSYRECHADLRATGAVDADHVRIDLRPIRNRILSALKD